MAALGSLVLVAAGLFAPDSAMAASCLSAIDLNRGTVSSFSLESGAQLKTFSFSPGVANGSMIATKISVIEGNLKDHALQITRPSIGEGQLQDELAQKVSAIGYINTDYFDESKWLNHSAVIQNGELIYAPPFETTVVGTTSVTYKIETGYPASTSFWLHTGKYSITGVNLKTLPASGTVAAYTSKFSGAQLPSNRGGVLIRSSKIVKVYPKPIKSKPTSGVLLITNSQTFTRLAKLKIGQRSTFVLPPVAQGFVQLKAAKVRSAGTVKVGNQTLPIIGVNTDTYGGAYSYGARLYDSNFTTYRPTVRGAYSLALSADGRVLARSRTVSHYISSNAAYVLQLGLDGSAFYNAALVGSTVSIDKKFETSSGAKFINAVGTGGQKLKSGINIQDCYGSHEQIRPRTGLGWNTTTGKVWMITTSSGQNLNDYGFRMGGSTIHQMFDWLKQLGATDGAVFDGGGTTTMYARIAGNHRRIDIPDAAWLREVPTGLALVAKD